MRIVHTCLRYPPAIGGTESYVHELVERTRIASEASEAAKAWEALRDVRVLTSKMRTHGPITELDPEQLLDDPMYVQRLHHLATPFISYPRLQALSYYLSHHQPDIIHGYSFWYHPADSAARYARRQHIPFIFHPLYYENDVRDKIQWKLYAHTVGRATFAAADIVAVTSPFEQSLITNAGFPVQRFELIPPGFDEQEFTLVRPNPFLERKIPGPIVLAVARLAAGKGLEDLVKIAPALRGATPNVHIAIVGEDFGYKSALEKEIQRLGVSTYVHLLGKLSREELIGAYQHATVFVHPSYYEAFGIVLAEAQLAGIPVIGRNITAIPYVASPSAGAQLFSTREEMAAACIALLQNETLRLTSGQQGRAYIRQNFSWPRIINKVLSLYDELKPV